MSRKGNPHYSLVYLSVFLFYLNPHHILSMDSLSSRFLLQPSLVHSAGAATISPSTFRSLSPLLSRALCPQRHLRNIFLPTYLARSLTHLPPPAQKFWA